MQQGTKIMLSPRELELVTSAEWILTKHAVINKVYGLFGRLAENFPALLQHLPPTLLAAGPKISRGENYRLLPYVVLDYPRSYTGNSVCAIRCMFWWGNFFSCTLHLGGDMLEQHTRALLDHYQFFREQDWWICVYDDPWQYHYESDNYLSVSQCTAATFAAVVRDKPFIKLSRKIPLQEWEQADVFLQERFRELVGMLA